MLNEFISKHRARITDAAAVSVRARGAPAPTDEELAGLPVFIDQLAAQLLRRQGLSADVGLDIGVTAARLGAQLSRLGIGISHLVHDYGAVSQAVLGVAAAEGAVIPADECQLFNMCLDEAIAEALASHGGVGAEARDRAEAEHLGVLVHELRNALGAVVMAYESLKRTGVSPRGSRTGAIIDRNLRRLESLIDRSLADVRLRAAPELRPETFKLAELAAEIEGPAIGEAEQRGVRLLVHVDAPLAEVCADRQLVVSALSNLLQNALKFTHAGGTVIVRVSAAGERVWLEVDDECGGLSPEAAAKLFQPFVQGSRDRGGVGLGLTIARRAAEAHGGSLRFQDKPGHGCVFTIDLPRQPLTEPARPRAAPASSH
jgi:signal transduction histidine kinase